MSNQVEKFVAKGKREPTEGMKQQAEYSVGLGEEHKEKLGRFGFPETKLVSMRELATGVATLSGTQSATWEGVWATTRNEVSQVQEAKDAIFVLREAVPMVLREVESQDVTMASFTTGDLGRSTPKIIGYIDRVLPLVAPLDEAFKPYFEGKVASVVLKGRRDALAGADGSQLVAKAQAPDTTAELNEKKGRLLQLIEDMNRVGRIAYRGQATVAARFNKDILLRARRSRSGKDEPGKEAPAPA